MRPITQSIKYCVNGDGRPVQPPSKVLCKKCLKKLGQKLQDILNSLKEKTCN